MKKPNYIIKVKNPCQEDWDEMTQNDKGKHCVVCAKTVVDFSKLSDNQVIKVIENSKGKVCGHFNKTQLNRTVTQTNEQKNPFLYQILAGALLLSSCDTDIKEKANIEVVNTQNNDEKTSQTVKSATKVACNKIEEDDSLRQIEEQLQIMRKGDYVIEFRNAEEIRLDFIEDSILKEEVASLLRSEYTNKYKKRNSK